MNLGFPELIIISVIALLLFGPKRLPDVARGMGKSIHDFKKALNGEDETRPSVTVQPRPPAAEIVSRSPRSSMEKSPTA